MAFHRNILGIAASHHERMIFPLSDRNQEQGNYRKAELPAASSFQTTRKPLEKRKTFVPHPNRKG
jgi:hypothetical protein